MLVAVTMLISASRVTGGESHIPKQTVCQSREIESDVTVSKCF